LEIQFDVISIDFGPHLSGAAAKVPVLLTSPPILGLCRGEPLCTLRSLAQLEGLVAAAGIWFWWRVALWNLCATLSTLCMRPMPRKDDERSKFQVRGCYSGTMFQEFVCFAW